MLTILTLADLRSELEAVHVARSSGLMAWDAYVVATDVLNDAIISLRDFRRAEVLPAAFRKARILARADALTLIAEVSKRTALHSPSGFLNRNATPSQVAHIARCNRTLDRCHKASLRLSAI